MRPRATRPGKQPIRLQTTRSVCDAFDMARWCRRNLVDTPLGGSGRNSTGPGSSNQWAASEMPWTTPWSSRSSPPSKRKLLDRHRWETRQQLSLGIFKYIEGWHNPERRPSYNNHQSPVKYRHRQVA